jgi:hypothetical protein
MGLRLDSIGFTIETFVVYTELTSGLRPLGSVVEHSLHTRGVNGSNPLAGTKFLIRHWRPQAARFGLVISSFSVQN